MSHAVGVAAAAATAAVLGIVSQELRTAKVAGSSMAPTFQTGSSILIERVSLFLGAVDRDWLTKRVVGVGGDWLYARDGRLVRVPTEHVWVEVSRDTRCRGAATAGCFSWPATPLNTKNGRGQRVKLATSVPLMYLI
ncbi:signal peptidase I [Emiliania huxleyi CCMP1516]|uniref:Peptidase S26 domain-containing protein n=2 Tax=Emiliania huxleyi TaxID=2903 RepID=A0A0D3K1H2_EMIH1|nr:signal peptidase I [Emiliania huxleyi CCMP1516]EOD29607.1 signal peptidase I [Emiliania huxleyi CCMP1516]|eukprot:XP_005782036.1 signal peptidase I [Emiliania huxleyi CCMP1516]